MTSDITIRREAAWPAGKTPTIATSGITSEQIHRARLTVARSATDAADCAELLDILGLLNPAELITGATP